MKSNWRSIGFLVVSLALLLVGLVLDSVNHPKDVDTILDKITVFPIIVYIFSLIVDVLRSDLPQSNDAE